MIQIWSAFRSYGWLAVILSIAASLGHASASQVPATVPAPAEQWSPPPADPAELLKLDQPMLEYFDARVSRSTPTRYRLFELVQAILSPSALGFTYVPEATLSARETFRQRRGNCVSFSFLVVALARHYGFDARFQNVDVGPHWDRFGRFVASVVHLDVRVVTNDGGFVVDLRPDLVARFDPEIMRVVADERACAEFYSDVGFFRLVQGKPDEAVHYLRRAIEIDGRYASGWANLGAMYLHLGDLPAARNAFERSLRENHTGFESLVGLVDVLQKLGTPDDLRQAAKLEHRANRIRERNPYYQQYLATVATQQADWSMAEKRIHRAISLKRDEPEFYSDLAQILRHLGREHDAMRAEKTATKLAAERPVPGIATMQ